MSKFNIVRLVQQDQDQDQPGFVLGLAFAYQQNQVTFKRFLIPDLNKN